MIPIKPLSNYDLKKYAKLLDIQNFRGVFMKDRLPKKIKNTECGILNLDNYSGIGSHWISYKKVNDTIFYYDSFALNKLPILVEKYFETDKNNVLFNNHVDQKFNEVICGHLCLNFLTY
jgi:hypothetical protein